MNSQRDLTAEKERLEKTLAKISSEWACPRCQTKNKIEKEAIRKTIEHLAEFDTPILSEGHYVWVGNNIEIFCVNCLETFVIHLVLKHHPLFDFSAGAEWIIVDENLLWHENESLADPTGATTKILQLLVKKYRNQPTEHQKLSIAVNELIIRGAKISP